MNLRRAVVLAVTTVSVFGSGCSHKIDSPPASSKAVAPDLVCVEQLTTQVVLTGNGFTPMPSKTLEKAPELLLPKIALSRKQDLSGAAASGTANIPDDPAAPSKSLVHWTSEQSMAFQVTPDLALAPGLYDVVVTNPDGVHATTFAGGLAAVPRPTITAPSPDILCDAESDQTVVLTGTTLLQVGSTLPMVHMGANDFPATKVGGCSSVPGTHAEGQVQSCTSATFVIPKGACTPGVYPITLTNPAPANCVSTDPISITVVAPPTVAAIAADLVCDAQGDQTMTVTGTGFLQLGSVLKPTVMIGDTAFAPATVGSCSPIAGSFVEGAAQTCTTMTFVIPLGSLPAGDYPVVVVNPAPADCKSLEAVTLHIAPPPTLAAVAPLAICDAQNNQIVTIAGANFLQVGALLPMVTIGTVVATPTQATGCVPVAGTFTEGAAQECAGLVVGVPKGTFAKGIYPVAVRNPDPAGCVSKETVSLTVDDPPAVTGTAPATLCEGGGTLDAIGTGFLASATISLLPTSGVQTPVMSNSASVNAAGTQISAVFGAVGVPGATFNVLVDNGDGCIDPAPHKTVTVVTGPIAFFADPEVVYNGINTRVTVYATTLQLPAKVTIVPTGATSPVTELVTAPVVGHPNRVQVIVPEGQASGSYDLWLNDATGCQTVLPKAVTVTGALNVALKSVVAPFGYSAQETPVTILRDKGPTTNNGPFVATPRVFLNPTTGSNTTAIQVQSVSFVDGDTLTAVVPKGQPTGVYDLVVVNPDGTVGLLANAFTEQSVPPPIIATITPASMVAATDQTVVISGQNFSAAPTVTLSCQTDSGTAAATPTAVASTAACTGSNCTVTATIDASVLASGDLCVLRLANADKSYFDYSAVGVTGPSLNISASHAGHDMNVGRRALAAAAGNATSSARFVYAVGGDDGTGTPTSLSSTEFASVDLFGNMGSWQLQPASPLGTARSFPASAVVGRYVYVAGGFDGTNNLKTAERAMILSPLEVPALDIDDLIPVATAGVDPGYWYYRVSATFAPGDLDNPGGESLASDEFIVKVPTFAGHKIQVALAWTAPLYGSGTPVKNISGYNIYRTKAANGSSGKEVLLASVSGSTLKYTDDGSATPGTQSPLPLGSTGKWAQLPAMATARKGAAGAAAFDPAAPNTFYFYALMGLDGTNSAVGSYEYLPVTIDGNGHQTVGTWATGTSVATTKRWQVGAWVVDRSVSSTVTASDSYIFVGPGSTASTVAPANLANVVDAAKIAAGGELSAFATLAGPGKDAGYGVCAANGQLFRFGGSNGTPSTSISSSLLAAPEPALGNWNNEGVGTVDPRYLMGSTVQSAFIFLVGGDSGATPAQATKTTELVIW